MRRLARVAILVLLTLGSLVGSGNTDGDAMALILSALAETNDAGVQARVLRGVNAGLAGHANLPRPARWRQLNAHLQKGGDRAVLAEVAKLNRLFGDEGATKDALKVVRDTNADIDMRRDALRSLATMGAKELVAILPGLFSSKLRIDAIRAYASFDTMDAPRILLKRYNDFDDSAQRAAIETLATRRSYAKALLAAIADKRVPKTAIPAYVARTLQALLGQGFEDVYGPIQRLGDDKASTIAAYKKKIESADFDKADASRGRVVFQQICASCHQMYGTGGEIGPDLTGSNRGDADYILLNMVDPNFDVPDSYKMVTITTKKGQVMVGSIIKEDDVLIELKSIGQKQTIAKSNVKSRVVADASMMPEGLLKALNDQQFLDLITYLRTNKQVELPK